MTRMHDGIEWAPHGIPVSFEPPSVPGEPETEVSAEELEAREVADLREFETIVKRIRSTLLACALMLVKSVDDAEDVVQDVLTIAWRRDVLAQCSRDVDRFEACLVKSARNGALNKLRGRGREGSFLGRFALFPRKKREGDD